ncbi:hypothetical protein PPROV_001049700 [Pycnococcus provasolii]|uniref:SRR1-like domain-containing protein n=1 Tax=Pycnococcus provasolii TaxID=41880 RepID=A0A830I418_9CHLO|nr:hypothetical protein PPROV_001049700 [Pycnococcus provasolii]
MSGDGSQGGWTVVTGSRRTTNRNEKEGGVNSSSSKKIVKCCAHDSHSHAHADACLSMSVSMQKRRRVSREPHPHGEGDAVMPGLQGDSRTLASLDALLKEVRTIKWYAHLVKAICDATSCEQDSADDAPANATRNIAMALVGVGQVASTTEKAPARAQLALARALHADLRATSLHDGTQHLPVYEPRLDADDEALLRRLNCEPITGLFSTDGELWATLPADKDILLYMPHVEHHVVVKVAESWLTFTSTRRRSDTQRGRKSKLFLVCNELDVTKVDLSLLRDETSRASLERFGDPRTILLKLSDVNEVFPPGSFNDTVARLVE